MPVAKLLGTSSADAMKAEEGSDSLDTFIRQAVGKEPLFSFSRTGDSPMQWIQLLHALDQQDLPGWPLLTPMKVQMQKCDKCAREFCSPINYRRHIRVHRRSLNFHKESQKYRDLLGAFWDKLSYEDAKDIMSFKDVNLEEVAGSSIVRNITANLRKPIFLSLPQVYVKAGSVLVDIIQGRPSRLPISSQELFSILDDASERTFLSAGTAESLQKFIFDGEAGKIGLEIKNLIACTSFLAEQRLVKAWLADKDAEALRCQKLLVEEEEAAQRRQAEILERKRQRKLRQKEQRARDQSNEVKGDLYAASDVFETTPSTETSSLPTSSGVDLLIPDEDVLMPLETIQFSNNEEDVNIESQGGCSSDHSDSTAQNNTKHPKAQTNDLHHLVTRWQVPKLQKGGRNGFHGNQNVNTLKREQSHKHREQRAPLVNSSKIWTKKPKPENGGELVKSRVQNDAINQSNCQLMIGSISVTVRSPSQHQANNQANEVQESGNMEVKKSSVQTGTNRSTVKIWRPRHDSRGQLADSRSNKVMEEDAKGDIEIPTATESCCQSNDETDECQPLPFVEDGGKPEAMLFSVDAAKAFLAQRWKEAISGDHSKLVLAEPPGEGDGHESQERAENRIVSMESSSHNTNVRGKFATKGVKTKYIPKQRGGGN
ncbi:uncharacterized protein LOC112508518 isoform X1 [Cynara cardunculus var. scolymus]|uniref:uncharacterized protein LOC112508518 isoform X1 n=2 Tax=Cynara cardunculus var. scolymus TaxID=59895 RepID=UPI000D62A252|nr:uncharacterized protein LOC112508518 isoform X1 [Cynara cardunculus var. scolymus]